MVRVLAFLVVVIVVVAGMAGWWLTHRALPVRDGVITLDSLLHSATVRFDDRSIPYIEASSDRDMWLVQGYVTASDRMFQMDMLRRTALGEMAEVYGDTCLPEDKLMRTIGFNRLAREELSKLSQDARAYLDAYCLGINEYLSRNVQTLPLEFTLLGYRPRPWMPADTLAVLKFLQYENDESWRLDDLRQRVADKASTDVTTTLFEEQLKPITLSALPSPTPARLHSLVAPLFASRINSSIDSRQGSNAFAIYGGLSDTRGGLLACDKHSQLTVPDRYYIVSMAAPGLHLCGATIPGVPGIMVGRNDLISWGSINLKADVQDLYLEQFSSQFPGKYRTPEGWQNTTEVIEEIKVRFKRNLLHKVQFTVHGPLLQRAENTGVVLNWTGLRNTGPLLDSIWKLNKAKDWAAFAGALDSYQGSPQSFVYADKNGRVGYKVAGAVPDRRSFPGGSLLMAGWSIKQDPPLMRPQDLPQQAAPADGIAIAGEQRIPGHPSINSPYRVMRQRSVLSSYKKQGQKAGMPEMALLQSDTQAPLIDLVKKSLHQAIEHAELIDKYQLTALETLDKWDGQMTSDSKAASIYETFLTTIAHRLIEPKLGYDLTREYMERWPRWSTFVEQMLRARSPAWLPPGERSYDAFLITTFGQSLKGIRVKGSEDNPRLITWGSLHQARFRHPLTQYSPSLSNALSPLLDVGPVGVGGDQDTVSSLNVTAWNTPWNFSCTLGPSQRLLVDMMDSDKLYQNLALGQSGQLLSAYRSDQLKPWLSAEPHAVAYSASQLDKQTQHKLILTKQ